MVDRQQEPERRWYVRRGDHVDGPHPESRVKEWLRDGHLPGDVFLSADCRTWRPVKAPQRRAPDAAPAAPARPIEPRPTMPAKLPPPVRPRSEMRRRRRRLRRWIAVAFVAIAAVVLLFVLDLGG